MSILSVVVVAAFSVFFIGLLLSAFRSPQAWSRVYQPEPWEHVLRWIVALFVAAFVGISLAGGSSVLISIVGILAFSAFDIAWRFWVALASAPSSVQAVRLEPARRVL